jgi:DNA helicase-2/ATP-dependent DNA helicase PcrA
VLDRGDAADLLDVVRHDLGYSKVDAHSSGTNAKRFPRKDTCLAIYSHRVNTQGTLAETLESAFPWCAEWEEDLKKLFGAYVEKKLNNQALDYDDLLLYWHAMMADEALAREIGEAWDHVLVDEYQDTNVLQAQILQRLRPTGAGLTVVGDDAQSIYSFRAASVENILGFSCSYEDTKTVVLEENYRSTQPVLDAANALMKDSAGSFQKNLKSRKMEGNRPRYVTVADDAAQAQYVVTRVLEAREQGVDLMRQAVLFRSSHHSDVLELELVRRNIPYVKYGGLKFLEAAHVKDLLAVLRWADNPRNRIAAFRVLQLLPGMGPANTQRACEAFEAAGFRWSALEQYPVPAAAREHWPAFTALMMALGSDGATWEGQVTRVRAWYEPQLERLYEAAQARRGDLEQLERLAVQYPTREAFVTELTLDPPQASGDLAGDPLLDEDYLILSTVHSAKGQEWESVHVLNATDGSFPSEFSAGRPELLEEERRLLYVAMTRARQELHLIAPVRFYVTQQSRTGDKYVHGTRSRFLTETVLARFERAAWPAQPEGGATTAAGPGPRIDVVAQLRKLW